VDLSSIAGRLNSLSDQFKSFLSGLDIWRDTTLIANIACGLTVLLLGKSLQLLIDLCTLAQSFGKCWSSTVSKLGLKFASVLGSGTYEGTIMNSWKARRPPA
jgi:hypothetical protein